MYIKNTYCTIQDNVFLIENIVLDDRERPLLVLIDAKTKTEKKLVDFFTANFVDRETAAKLLQTREGLPVKTLQRPDLSLPDPDLQWDYANIYDRLRELLTLVTAQKKCTLMADMAIIRELAKIQQQLTTDMDRKLREKSKRLKKRGEGKSD